MARIEAAAECNAADELPGGPGEAEIREWLRAVIDPELGINIVDLGLVYRVEPTRLPVRIEMTMTSPACPLGEAIVEEIRTVLAGRLPAGATVDVALVWAPLWEPSMMSPQARRQLGWPGA